MNAIVLSIGDELVLGQTIDTNSAWLSARLASMGCGVAAHVTVADDESAIRHAILDAARRCELLVITGGLGPTRDDVTRQAIAGVLEQPLELNAVWLARMEAFFRERGRAMPEANRIQAMIPRGAKMIDNSAGTAPGIDAVLAKGGAGQICRLFAMPGVPSEMKIMFQRDVGPHIAAAGGGAVILSRTLHTFGVGESSIGEMLGNLMDRARNPSVGTTVSGGVVSLRINARFADAQKAGDELEKTAALCGLALGDLIYGREEETLGSAVGSLLLPPLSVTTAESCTGGLLAKMITDVPGSSRYFRRGWITYSDEAKTQLLNVPSELIAENGAVSEPVVQSMARGALKNAGASFALAVSGIAGPEGGTPSKPVGTVCIGLAGSGEVKSRTFLFPGSREMVRDRSAKMALTFLRYQLLGKAIPF